MNTKDIYKINHWVEEELDSVLSFSSHPLRKTQSFPHLDKIKYYEMIERFLEKYIIEKLEQCEKRMIVPNHIEINYQTLKELFNTITNFEERQNIFSNFCFYILSILSSLQGYEIIWKIEKDLSYIDQFTLKPKKDDNSLIDSLHTHQNSDCLKVFIYLLNVLKLECYHMEGYSNIPSKIKK